MRTFTKEQAIAIQQEHLKLWEQRLNPEWFAKLKAWAEETNATQSNPHEIRRGGTLTDFICNPASYVGFI